MSRLLCFVCGLSCLSVCLPYSSALAEIPRPITGNVGKNGSLGVMEQALRQGMDAILPRTWQAAWTTAVSDHQAATNADDQPGPPVWRTSYQETMDEADKDGRMMLIWFFRPDPWPLGDQFEAQTLSDPEVRKRLLVRLPLDAKIRGEDKPVELLKHEAFAEMRGLPGLAIIDLAHKDAAYYGQVVSVFPFLGDRIYTAEQMRVVLDLPPGTLTQRTMIYAVRTHPERPASTQGQFLAMLASEAQSAAAHQAQIGRQGHHSWESRFQRITARLPAGLMASEVCAESWPGQGLLESAIECVRCWRLSSGHWEAVRAAHRCYGYDIQRGANGIWYATGIFGRG
jgi:hypothetical protein